MDITKNPDISKNPLWNRMQDATSFVLQKEKTSQVAGIGDRPKGADLRRITNAIHKDLDNEIHEDDFKVDEDMNLEMPDIMWDNAKLRKPVKNMDGIDFWLQKGMERAVLGKTDAAMDYYRQGLRKNPTNL